MGKTFEKQNGAVPKWAAAVMLVLCVAVLIWNVCAIIMNLPFNNGDACMVVDSAAVLAAVLYCVTGFKKSSAGFFKAFLVIRLISAAMAPLFFLYQEGQTFQLTCQLLIFICLVIFTITLNMGKKYSYILSLLMIAISAISTAVYLFADDKSYIVLTATGFLLSVIFGLMIFAKYRNKEARGTK